MTHDDVTVGVLAAVPLFAGVTEAELAPLLPAVRRIELAEGEMLFQQGDPSGVLYLVSDGQLKVYTYGPNDQEIVLDIIGPDQVLGEMAFLDGAPRAAHVEALADCVLLTLDREPFLAYLKDHPRVAIHLLEYLTKNLRQRVLQAEVMEISDSPARLAQAVLFLAERDGRVEPGLVTSTLSKKRLAATIGTSRAWVSQMLNEWHRDGIIGLTGKRRLLLHDVDALRALTQRDK